MIEHMEVIEDVKGVKISSMNPSGTKNIILRGLTVYLALYEVIP